MTFDVVIKIVLTAVICYLALNSIIKFHFSEERFQTYAYLIIIIILLFIKDTNDYLLVGIIILTVVVITIIFKIIYSRKKEFKYFLLNVLKRDYNKVNEEIIKAAQEQNISLDLIDYEYTYPYIVSFKGLEKKEINKLFKKLDKIMIKKLLSFTMYNYWYIVVCLILIAYIWRF